MVDLHSNTDERFGIFRDNVIRIVTHNSEVTKTFKRGINKYSAMTHEEVIKFYNLKGDQNCSATNKNEIEVHTTNSNPTNWDWRDHNGVSPVKD